MPRARRGQTAVARVPADTAGSRGPAGQTDVAPLRDNLDPVDRLLADLETTLQTEPVRRADRRRHYEETTYYAETSLQFRLELKRRFA